MTPSGWVRLTLGEGVELLSGQHISAADYTAEPPGTPYLTGPADFQNGFISVSKYTSSPKVLCHAGDILLTVKGSGTGKLVRALDEYCISRQLMAVRPRSWDPSFVYHLLASASDRFGTEASGTIPGITREQVLETPVLLPPLPEQRKIAAILSAVDDAIQATQAVIDQTGKVRQGLLQQLLTKGIGHTRFKRTEIGEIPEGWRLASIEDLSEFVTSGSRGWAKYYSDSGPLFIRITNLSRSTTMLDLSEVKHVSLPAGTSEGQRTRLQAGDALVSITADLGMIGVVGNDLGEAYVNQHVALIRPKRDVVDSAFLGLALSSAGGQSQLHRFNDPGAKAGLNLPSIRKTLLPLPPPDEQKRIIAAIVAFDSTSRLGEVELSSLHLLKAGLMQDLLTGRVRVKVA